MKASIRSFLASFFTSALGTICGVIAAFILIPVILIVSLNSMNSWSSAGPIKEKAVLHILLDGEVVDRAPSVEWLLEEGRGRIRLQRLIKAIRIAREDKRVVGAVLDIRDMQMGWSSATAIRRELAAFKEAKKFVYTYADRLNEMGLYLASGTDRTYMQPHGDVELDGLASENPFMKGLFAKLEVKPLVFRVGKFKAAVEPFILDKMSPENREQTSAFIGDIWGEARTGMVDFINTHATVDGKPNPSAVKPEQFDQWVSDLEIHSVDEAKAHGLITDKMFSDEFDDLVHETAQWGENDEPNYVTVRQMRAEEPKSHEKRKIALVIAEGEIVKGEGGVGEVGDDTFLGALQEINEDESVAAVVVRINSPGGDALASDVLWRELSVLDETKPVVASMGDIAASGGYYMAAGARHIVAEPTTITGSIGVFGLLFNAESLFRNKLGVVFDRVATHKHSKYGGFTRSLDPKEAQTIQKGVDRVYKRFIEVVAQSRGFEKTEDVEAIAEGRVWSGKRAIEIGLVDELGGLDLALSKAQEFAGLGDGYKIDVYPKNTDRISRFLEQLSEESASSGLRGSIASALETPWLASAITKFARAPEARVAVDTIDTIERIRASGRPGILARAPFSSKMVK